MTENAEARGWGKGWPACSAGPIVTLVRSDGVRLPVHTKVKELIALLINETERRGYNVLPGDSWGYACRAIRGTNVPSNHSWGLAVDINASANPMQSTLKTDMPSWMPVLWERYKFRWGGHYTGRKDAMHYEFMGTPGDAEYLTVLARKELGQEDDLPYTEEQLKQIIRDVMNEPPQSFKEGGVFRSMWRAVARKKDGAPAAITGYTTVIQDVQKP